VKRDKDYLKRQKCKEEIKEIQIEERKVSNSFKVCKIIFGFLKNAHSILKLASIDITSSPKISQITIFV
jgi:hypothetical protein